VGWGKGGGIDVWGGWRFSSTKNSMYSFVRSSLPKCEKDRGTLVRNRSSVRKETKRRWRRKASSGKKAGPVLSRERQEGGKVRGDEHEEARGSGVTDSRDKEERHPFVWRGFVQGRDTEARDVCCKSQSPASQ